MKKINFNSVITKKATTFMAGKKFAKEWQYGIMLTFILRLVTSFISIYAGYYYLFSQLSAFFKISAITIVISIVSLSFIELLTIYFLHKSFKFIFKKKISTSIIPILLAIFLFSTSFLLSAKGLALERGNVSDNIQFIKQENEINKKDIIDENNNIISGFNSQIALIKNSPSNWKNGKRIILSPLQLQNIKNLYTQIYNVNLLKQTKLNELSDNYKIKLAENSININAESTKFYKVAIYIMITQLLCNFFLVFAYHRINLDENYKSIVKELAEEESKNLSENLITLGLNKMKSTFFELASTFDKENQKEIETLKNYSLENKKIDLGPEIQKPTKAPNKIAGFLNSNKNNIKNNKNNTESSKYPNSSIIKNSTDNFNLAYLNKHKIIVNNFKLNYTNAPERLTNDMIRLINKQSNKANYKSHSTITNVFNCMKTVGYKDIKLINNQIIIK